MRAALEPQFKGGSVSVITIGSQNQVRVSTNYKITDNSAGIDDEIIGKLYTGLKPFLGNATQEQFASDNIQSSQKVGPSMADDIKNSAVLAVLFAMVCMALYILVRFRDVAFSVGVFISVAVTTLCIIALLHAAVVRLCLSPSEVDQTFIAAILTVIGYSINDTVVVFDRIRETIKLYPKRARYEVINAP